MTKSRKEYLAELGERLRTARSASGVTRENAVEISGVDSETVRRWEDGRNEPGVYNLFSIAQAYSVSVEWLIGEASALDREELEVIKAMRDDSAPIRRAAIIAVAQASPHSATLQRSPLRQVAESQSSYQADEEQ